MRAHRGLPLVLLAAALGLGCSNAGEGRILSITSTGTVTGTVFFDTDGSRTNNFGDANLGGIGILLFTRGTRDTIARDTSDGTGVVRLANIPVGNYTVAVDSATIDDTLALVSPASTDVTLTPDDTVGVSVGISFPHKTVAQARDSTPFGRKIFVDGIVLNGRTTFADATVHLRDATAAIRVTRVQATPPFSVADSVRFLGRTSFNLGQPTLDDVLPLALAPRFLPDPDTLISGVAAGAAAGRLDAGLVIVINATIADTATVLGDMRLTVNDGSGALEVLLDRVADPTFIPPTGVGPPYPYVPGARFDMKGVLVPTGTAGAWRLKPRSATDLVLR